MPSKNRVKLVSCDFLYWTCSDSNTCFALDMCPHCSKNTSLRKQIEYYRKITKCMYIKSKKKLKKKKEKEKRKGNCTYISAL